MSDEALRQYVEQALHWDPRFDAADIGVSVEQGVATLRGHVRSYGQKVNAERAALGVRGVKGVANDLTVRLDGHDERSDTAIAQAAVTALEWHTLVPHDRITVSVADGWLTLNGTVDHEHQRAAAERAVRYLTGVKGVANAIRLRTPVSAVNATQVAAQIDAAFRRSAALDASRIDVTAREGTVVLRGMVRSWAERQEAERAAWAAPGVTSVDDRLEVAP
jgi:osmotically-inducible protein OsmY